MERERREREEREREREIERSREGRRERWEGVKGGRETIERAKNKSRPSREANVHCTARKWKRKWKRKRK